MNTIISQPPGGSRLPREQKAPPEQADPARRAESGYFAAMAHDMRTPINAIAGMAHLAEKCPGNPPQTKEYLERIRLSSAMLLSLSNDILNMSQLDCGKLKIAQTTFTLDKLFHQLKILFDAMALEKQLSLQMTLSPKLFGRYSGDEIKINRILMNVLGNAVKYTGPGQHILLCAAPANGMADVVCFTVWDTGPGIDEDTRSRLFDPFERGGDSEEEGAGLGLAIARRYAEVLGGAIDVASAPCQGSVFTIRLPLKKVPDPGKAAGTPAPATKWGKGQRILLVEDSTISQQVTQWQLQTYGFEVETANDGAQGLAKFEESTEGWYDLILMDIQTPRMSGLTATRRIRALPRKDAALPIFAMSAGGSDNDLEKWKQAGMNGHLSKPLQSEALRRVLSGL